MGFSWGPSICRVVADVGKTLANPGPQVFESQSVLKWLTQHHVRKYTGGGSCFWLGLSLTNLIYPGVDCGSRGEPLRLPKFGWPCSFGECGANEPISGQRGTRQAMDALFLGRQETRKFTSAKDSRGTGHLTPPETRLSRHLRGTHTVSACGKKRKPCNLQWFRVRPTHDHWA